MTIEGSSQATAESAPDYDEIVRVIQLYVDGFNKSDINKFTEAFHEDARITFTDAEGELSSALLSDLFEDWAAPWEGVPGDEFVLRIVSVIQAGDVASVVLEMHTPNDPSNAWVDIHSLLRIDGVWKDMNKTATHSSRAGWASTVTASEAP
jgi:ketosteroid isomerase-like protein